MDKTERRAIMSKFLKKDKLANNSKPTDEKSGFYETLIMKKKDDPKQPTKYNSQTCKKMGIINNLMKKKYMIPSQFPNITQVHSTNS